MRSEPHIPQRFTTFPPGYINDVRGWGIDAKTLAENLGKLLTIDLDYGTVCSLNCPSCFRKNNIIDTLSDRTMSDTDLRKVVLDAKSLGLRSVKFLGAGEPLENPGFIEFLRFLKEQEIIPVVFTKGHVIGDDAVTERVWGYLGIHTGAQLVEELDACGASVVVGFNSFDDKLQAKLSGSPTNYAALRNRTLELLYHRGFADSNPTRLAVGVNPVTKRNVNEASEIYRWARLRGIYAVVTPTMVSGRSGKQATWAAITPSAEELVRLYEEIYRFNISTGLQTLEQIRSEGVAAYAGGHPCNQVAAGLYVTSSGAVLRCPGDVLVEGSIWESDIKAIWRHSTNFSRQGAFNNCCPAKDGKSIPLGLYGDVERNLMKEVKSWSF